MIISSFSTMDRQVAIKVFKITPYLDTYKKETCYTLLNDRRSCVNSSLLFRFFSVPVEVIEQTDGAGLGLDLNAGDSLHDACRAA